MYSIWAEFHSLYLILYTYKVASVLCIHILYTVSQKKLAKLFLL